MRLRRYDDVDYYYQLRCKKHWITGANVYYMGYTPKYGADDGTHTKVYPSVLVKRNRKYWQQLAARSHQTTIGCRSR